MHAAGQGLVGRHDFSSFETAGSERPDSIRTIHELTVSAQCCTRPQRSICRANQYDRITIEVAGDGFLYNMVRTIVGTLVEVGVGKRDIDWPAEVLAARTAAGRPNRAAARPVSRQRRLQIARPSWPDRAHLGPRWSGYMSTASTARIIQLSPSVATG